MHSSTTKQGLFSKSINMFPSDAGWKLVLLLISMIIAAILEMAGVGMIMPLIAIIDNPDIINTTPALSWIMQASKASDYKSFLMIISGFLIAFYLSKNLFLAMIMYWQSAFMAKSEADLANNLLRKYLSMPYLKYLEHNTSELVNNISNEVSLLFAGLIKPMFFILSDLFVTISILALLIYMAPLATIAAIIVIGISVIAFYIMLRAPLKKLGDSRQYHREKMAQWVNQSLGSIKEITVMRRKKFFRDSFAHHADEMIKTQTFYETVIQLPRVVIECFGVVILIIVMIALLNGSSNFIPTLSLFAMAAFRLMPSINRATSCATKVRYYTRTLNILHNDLTKTYEKMQKNAEKVQKNIVFDHKISLNNLSFCYPATTKLVLKDLSLTIKKGTSIGIIGPSGEGKSTLVDIILGLLPPTSGSVKVDGVDIHDNLYRWHKHLSYMPQTVYLTDDTIRRNIALGIKDSKINDKRIWNCLKKAHLDEYVKSLPDGLNSMVGERGAKLSGGQRQRIGIARALYSKPDVLILDEATTALDPETEQKICKTLQEISKDITIIAISHQPALISIADEVYRLKDGQLHRE